MAGGQPARDMADLKNAVLRFCTRPGVVQKKLSPPVFKHRPCFFLQKKGTGFIHHKTVLSRWKLYWEPTPGSSGTGKYQADPPDSVCPGSTPKSQKV